MIYKEYKKKRFWFWWCAVAIIILCFLWDKDNVPFLSVDVHRWIGVSVFVSIPLSAIFILGNPRIKKKKWKNAIIYKEAYQYNTGELVFTYDGEEWFIIDSNDNTRKIKEVNYSKVVYKVK